MLKLTKCMRCKKYRIENKTEVCEAFPDGIPEKEMHQSEEKECSNGIKFEEE